jgi:hypothetical protein
MGPGTVDKNALEKLGELLCGPPANHHSLTQRDLFAGLREAGGGWLVQKMADALNEIVVQEAFLENQDIAEDRVPSFYRDLLNSWFLKDVKPEGLNRVAFIRLLQLKGGRHANAWCEAFGQLWMRKAAAQLDVRAKKSAEDRLIIEMQNQCLKDRKLTHLSSLFEAELPLPVATAYVDLSIVEAMSVAPSITQLRASVPLSERIHARIEQRYAFRRSPQDTFDRAGPLAALILGDPGAGKSSLLKRMGLDIAAGKWNSADLPLFVEAREYWSCRKYEPNLSLIDFALRRFSFPTRQARAALETAVFPLNGDLTPGLLLLDGLDEIANSEKAIDIIYRQLRDLPASVRWIATCRPSGLVGSAGETFRCEMCDLEDEAIELLVRNWCTSVANDITYIEAEPLLQEILGSSSNREMARNPFLLTALCYLKSQAPKQGLPLTRIEVYSELIERIGQQAQLKLGDPNILDTPTIKGLQDFCFDLYDNQGGIQIFSEPHWSEFNTRNPGVNLDVHGNVLPARLLTSWDVGVRHYHFIHLSIQEFLIARAMLEHGSKFALAKRFHPAWRAIFRFYGALLFATGKHAEFRELVRGIADDPDNTGYIFLTVAEIFSDIGLKDTTDWLGQDLRSRLYYNALSADDIAAEALIDALVVLDPNWLEDKAMGRLRQRHSMLSNKSVYEELPMDGRSTESPYQLLARVRTPAACQTLRDTFFGQDFSEAEAAAEAFALIATQQDRRSIVERVTSRSAEPGFFKPLEVLADTLRRPEFLPALEVVIAWCKENKAADQEIFRGTSTAIALIGGSEALTILTRMLTNAIRVEPIDQDEVELLVHLIAGIGGREARAVLNAALEIPSFSDMKGVLERACLQATPHDEKLALALLTVNAESKMDVVRDLAHAAEENRHTTNAVCEKIAELTQATDELDIFDISCLEEARVRAGLNPYFSDLVLAGAKDSLEKFNAETDEETKESYYDEFMVALDCLEFSKWSPATSFLKEVLFDPGSHQEVLKVAIRVSGRLFADMECNDIVQRLLHLWFAAAEEFAPYASTAIGRLDIDTLFRFQSAHYGAAGLEQVGAEQDLLVFDDFWADKKGVQRPWKEPPTPVLFLVPIESEDPSANLAHELSRYGVRVLFSDRRDCAAAIVFGGKSDWSEQELTDFAQRTADWGHLVRPIFYVPEDMDLDDPKAYTAKIAKALGKRSIVP